MSIDTHVDEAIAAEYLVMYSHASSYLTISIICTLTRVATMCQSVLIEEAHLLKSFIISCANSHFTTSATTNGLLSLRLWNVVMTLFPLSCVCQCGDLLILGVCMYVALPPYHLHLMLCSTHM